MNVDVVVLGLASVVRPTSLAAVYALLGAGEPRRLLGAYLLVGVAFTLAVGIAAVSLVQVAAPPPHTTTTAHAIAAIVLGVLALGIAGYRATVGPREGPVGPDGREGDDGPSPRRRALGRRMSDPTVTVAGVAGVLTHLPGVFYLAALAAIVAENAGFPRALAQVGLYNAFWFAIPIAAVVGAALRPEVMPAVVERVTAAIARHRGAVVTGITAAAGVYLVVRGISGLVG
ncbi:MAG TPA: GAP family protein [Actinomycetospora sp.]|jgi:hypothetical protein|uniref:GAP family protein n=1 Tax=Actinomycetospora sp. TaxID=1872135 RepID=UPI002F3F7059